MAVSQHRLRRYIRHAKRKARSELFEDDWSSAKYCETFETLSEKLTRDNIERVDASKITVEEFAENYESRHVPVILTGLTTSWSATRKWSIPILLKKYRNQKFKCGEEDDGRSVKLKMKYFLEYMRQTIDDSPLYIFDSSFGERYKVRRLLEDYLVPQFFADDLFRYASEDRRPPYRWFLIGSSRSGTGMHVDPLGTSAWNALIKGSKKWCFFHPQTPKNILKPTKKEGGFHPDEAITWFATVYGRISSSDWLKEWKPIEAVQYPGEIIFVPGGWWHVVLNLTDTIAVTQNFCSKVNLPLVLLKTLAGRPKFCQHWLKCLRKARPDVLPIIDGVLKSVDGLINFAEASSSDSSSSTESSDSESESSNPSLQQHPFSNSSTAITKRIVLSSRKRGGEVSDSSVCPAKIYRSPV
ncbi:jmjC domain-containing protein [Loa loa]|uniref:JmjC domain-containing protein n=1 Tax=Loa loa TaxID=7209 RepID=A0A1I7VDB8_LOALO|nr:jmjC domain-containing protein [Loa loa]EFO23089.2 jmjC domain-containing protein [Loa loa]